MTNKTSLNSKNAQEIIDLWTKELREIYEFPIYTAILPKPNQEMIGVYYKYSRHYSETLVRLVFYHKYLASAREYMFMGTNCPCLCLYAWGGNPYKNIDNEEDLIKYLRMITPGLLTHDE